MPNEILKLKPVICILYKLFHFCFADSIVPTAWLKGVITPIPKSTFKDPCMPLNYRGRTLLSCIMSKVYTKVLHKRIISYVEEGNILVEEQSGFRAHRHARMQLVSFLDSGSQIRFNLRSLSVPIYISIAGITTYTKLYNCCVKPILEYSSAVWKDIKYI